MIPNEEIFDRLESYVDGALDAKARADVDRQLAGNPQLRKLVDELLFARDTLRTLPRAKAPPEMAETFQSSLERGALLGDDGPDPSDVVLRINRWPQFISVAAIVLLAVGLAAVIYKVVLPPNRARMYAGSPQANSATEPAADAPTTMRRSREVHKELAESEAADRKDRFGVLRDGVEGVAAKPMAKGGAEPSVPAPITSPEAANKADSDSLAMKRQGDGSTPADPGRAVVSADELREQQRRMGFVGKGGFGGVGGGGGASTTFKDDSVLRPAQQQATPLAASADEPLVLLVQSLDPRQANRDVARYFADNHIEYQAVTEAHNPDGPIPALQAPAGGASSPASGERSASAGAAPSQVAGRAAADARQQQESLQQQTPQQPGQAMNRGGNYAGNYASNSNNDRAANPPAPAPTQAPASPDNGYVYQQQGPMNRQVAGNPANTTGTSSQAAENPATTAPSDANNALNGLNNGVVLRNGAAPIRANTYRAYMTRRQVQQLNEQLARRDNQWTEVRNEPVGQQQAQQVDAVAQQRQAGEPGGVAAADKAAMDKAPAPAVNEGGQEMRRAPAPGVGDKESVALREKVMEEARAKGLGPSDEKKSDELLASAPRPAPATQPAGATTQEAAAVASAAGAPARGLKSAATDAAKDQLAATTRPAGQVESTGGVTRNGEAESRLSVTEAKQRPATEMGAGVESMQKKLAAATEPAGTFSKMGPRLQIDGAIKAEDAPVPVLIVVNDEPVVYNFPANAAPNAAAPATQPASPASAAASPTTAPAVPAKPTEK